MAGRRPLQYAVARIVPDEIRNEPVNIGIVLHDPQDGVVRTAFSEALSKLRTYADEQLDVEGIRLIVESIEEGIRSKGSEAGLLKRLVGQYNQQLQFSGPYGTLATDIEDEIESLYERFVTLDSKGRRKSRGVNRRYVVRLARRTFSAYQLAVQPQYTMYGTNDKFKFDFFYRNGRPQAFHCLSFGVDEDAAVNDSKILAYSLSDILDRAKAEHDRDLQNLAVTTFVYPPEGDSKRFNSAKSILKEFADVRNAKTDLEPYVKSLATAARGQRE